MYNILTSRLVSDVATKPKLPLKSMTSLTFLKFGIVQLLGILHPIWNVKDKIHSDKNIWRDYSLSIYDL